MANTTVKGKFNVVAENGDVQTIYPKTTGDQVLVDRSSNASVIPNDVANLQHIVNKMGSLALKSKVETSDFTTGTMISSLEDLKSNTDTGKIADATVVKDIESRVDTLENSNLVTVDELDAGLATKPDTEINDSVTSTSLTWSSKKLSDQLTELNSNTSLLTNRVNNLSTLQEGSTTGDAELIDIRTGYDSTNYSSAGEAVRSQVSDISNKINTLYNVSHNNMVTSINEMYIYLTKDGIKIYWSTNAQPILFTGTTYYFPKTENSGYAEINEINFNFNTAYATYVLVYNTVLYEFSIKKLEAKRIDMLNMYDIILCYACISNINIISYYTSITNHFFINDIENVSLKTPYLYSGKKTNSMGLVKDWEVITGEKYKIQIWNIENTSNLSKIVMFYYRDTDKTDYVIINDRIVYYNYIEYNINVTEDMKWLRIYTNTNNTFEWGISKVTDNFNSDDLNTGLIKSILSDTTKKLIFGSSTCNIFKKVVCCGDSYTSGHISGVPDIATITTNEDYAWPHYMELLTGNTWINCGHSGASSITWLTRDRGLPKAQTVGRTQAYVLGLQLNDVHQGWGVDLGTIEDIGADTDTTRTYYAGISRIIRELNTISPKAKIFVNTCPIIGGKYDTYNQALRDIVNEYKNTYPVHLIDLVNYKKYYDQISGDSVGSHYTAIGYERFAEIYKYVLSEYINTHITDFQDVHTIEYD